MLPNIDIIIVHLLWCEFFGRQHLPLGQGAVAVHVHPHKRTLNLGGVLAFKSEERFLNLPRTSFANLSGGTHSSLADLWSLASFDLLREENDGVF